MIPPWYRWVSRGPLLLRPLPIYLYGHSAQSPVGRPQAPCATWQLLAQILQPGCLVPVSSVIPRSLAKIPHLSDFIIHRKLIMKMTTSLVG